MIFKSKRLFYVLWYCYIATLTKWLNLCEEETIAQLETAKEEVKKPFAFENELKEKTERLNALNIELNLNEKDNAVIDDEPEQSDEPAEKKSEDRER